MSGRNAWRRSRRPPRTAVGAAIDDAEAALKISRTLARSGATPERRAAAERHCDLLEALLVDLRAKEETGG